MKHTLWIVLLAFASHQPLAFADGTKTSDVDSSAKSAASPPTGFPAPPFSGNDRVLWNAWYTVSLKPPGATDAIHYAYYNDRLELKKGQLYYRNDVWKKEEGFINEEHLGALAENDEHLKPLVYNFHSNYRSVETDIDGSASGNVMSVIIKKGGQAQPVLKKTLPSKGFFEIFFPVWLGFRLGRLKSTPTSFQTVLEDNPDTGFEAVSGTVKLEKPDDVATKTGTRRLAVDYGNVKTLWWVDGAGVAVRIEAPDQGRVVERSTQAVAEKFLE